MSRNSYQRKLRDQLESWQRKIDRLSAHMAQSGAGTRRRFEDQIQDLRAKQKAARRKLEQFDRPGRTTGRGAGMTAARRRVYRALQRIASGFR